MLVLVETPQKCFVSSYGLMLQLFPMVNLLTLNDRIEHTETAQLKVDGTSFPDAGSLVTTAHVTREICPQDLK